MILAERTREGKSKTTMRFENYAFVLPSNTFGKHFSAGAGAHQRITSCRDTLNAHPRHSTVAIFSKRNPRGEATAPGPPFEWDPRHILDGELGSSRIGRKTAVAY